MLLLAGAVLWLASRHEPWRLAAGIAYRGRYATFPAVTPDGRILCNHPSSALTSTDLETGISKQIENDEDHTIRQYDKVLFDPREAIPVELEHDNKLFVVHIDRVLAIFRRSDQPAPAPKPHREKDEPEDNDSEPNE